MCAALMSGRRLPVQVGLMHSDIGSNADTVKQRVPVVSTDDRQDF